MVNPQQYETFIDQPKDVIRFVENHEREGSGLSDYLQAWIKQILEGLYKEGHGNWPALMQLFGPKPLDVLEGPDAGRTVTVYEVRYITAPVRNLAREDAQKQLQMRNIAFVIEDGELTKYVLDLPVN